MFPIDSSNRSRQIDAALHAIKKGCVVALPYERLFGLAANAFDPEAVARVAAIKGRPADVSGSHPISVIAPDIDAVRRVTAEFSPLAHRLAEQYWPGLLTIVVKAAAGLPPPLVGRDGLIGVRIPGSCPAAELAGRSGLVLTATSANPAGCKDAISHEDVAGLNGVDLIVEGRVAGPPGSTVVDASGKYPNVIRSGFITLDEEI